MTEDTEQQKLSPQETGSLAPEQRERVLTDTEKEAVLQKRMDTHDAYEKSRAETADGVCKAESRVRALQAGKAFDAKCPEGLAADKRANAFDALGRTLRKTLGMAGMVAATFGALELSKLTTLTAGAATLDKSPTTQEAVQKNESRVVQECVRSLDVLRDLTVSQADKDKALQQLLANAKEHPQDFISFLQGSYQSVNQEQYHEQDGRTFSTDWALSANDMKRALEDSSFGKKNALELMHSLVDKSHDVKLGFSEKGTIILKEYPSQAYDATPRSENASTLRRDVIFNTTMSGSEYGVRGVISYDEKGAPYKLFVEAQKKNTHAFESDAINSESDERIALLSSEFQNEFSRYQHGEMGARTFGEYAKPGRELVQSIRVMTELEQRGLTDEAQVAARQIAQDVHRIESGSMVGKEAVEGKGFFDYSKFPERVQHELAKELPSLDQLKEVVNTRGSVVRHQFERDVTAKARAMMSGAEEK